MNPNETKCAKPLGADDSKDEANRRSDGSGTDNATGSVGQRAGHSAARIRRRPTAHHRVLHQG